MNLSFVLENSSLQVSPNFPFGCNDVIEANVVLSLKLVSVIVLLTSTDWLILVCSSILCFSNTFLLLNGSHSPIFRVDELMV